MHYVLAAEHTGQCSTSYASSAQPTRPLRARRLIARAVNDHGSSPPNPLARSANAETIAQRKLELIHDVKTKVRARQETLLAAGNDGRGAAVQNAQTSGGLPTSTLAVAALAGVAVLGLVYKKFFFTSAQQAVQSTVAAVTEVSCVAQPLSACLSRLPFYPACSTQD